MILETLNSHVRSLRTAFPDKRKNLKMKNFDRNLDRSYFYDRVNGLITP